MRIRLFILTLLSAFLLCGCSKEDGSERGSLRAENILFLMGDDHSNDVFGAYGNGLARTPNLDRLAAQGVQFNRAYCNSPVCTPSRQSIITGKLPHSVGVTLLRTALSEEEVTIAEHLKGYGFQTGAVGKMHFNSELKHGFDYRISPQDYSKHVEEASPPSPQGLEVRPVWRPFMDPARIWLNSEALPEGRYESDAEASYFVEHAIRFLQENRNNRFCLWLSFREPHSPFNFPVEFADRFDPADMPLPPIGEDDPRWIPAVFRDLTENEKKGIVSAYYTSVEYLDSKIGDVLSELERLGLDENTLVVYVGDHGYLLGHHGRFEKHTMWEPAVRSPLIIRGPGLFPAQSDALVEFIDLVPTILDYLNVPRLSTAQGKSLLPLLTGSTDQHRDSVFSEFLPDNKAMIRTREWKYVFTSGKADLAMGYATGYPPSGILHKLYDVQKDPGEFHNLANEPGYETVVKELQDLLLQRFSQTHPYADQLPKGLTLEEKLSWFCEPPETGLFGTDGSS